MKRLLVVLALLALAAPAAGQIAPTPRCAPLPDLGPKAGSPEGLADALSQLPGHLSQQLSERPLFLNVEGLAGARVTARFLVDGAPWAVETFTAPAAEGSVVIAKSCAELTGKSSVERPTKELRGGTPVVELLALHPDALDQLRGMAAKSPDRVQVEIRQDGQVLRSLPFEDLRAESDALRTEPFFAQPVTSSVRGRGVRQAAAPANGIGEKMTCEGLCQTQYEECLINECGEQIFCDTCEIEYEDCLAQCSPPPPPPPPPTCQQKVEYYYSTYLYGVFPTGWSECFYDPWGYYEGVWHDEYAYVFRTDYIEKTTHTDCSVTYRLISYSYSYFYCYDWTFSPCYYPWYPWNTCY
jgi:hypothetical protein